MQCLCDTVPAFIHLIEMLQELGFATNSTRMFGAVDEPLTHVFLVHYRFIGWNDSLV